MVVPSINPEDKVSLKYILRQFLKCQKIFKGYFRGNFTIYAKISCFFEYFRKYIIRQLLKCQKIFKGYQPAQNQIIN